MSPAHNAKTENSGRLLLRLPPDLHGELADLAEREGVSLNTLLTERLRRVAVQARRKNPR